MFTIQRKKKIIFADFEKNDNSWRANCNLLRLEKKKAYIDWDRYLPKRTPLSLKNSQRF